MIDLKQHIGMKVRTARQQRGLTQEQLAERIDKTAESISNIERGYVLPPLDTLYSLTLALDVPMALFFEDIGNKRSVAKSRLEQEQRLRGLAEDMSNEQLCLAVAILEAIRAQQA